MLLKKLKFVKEAALLHFEHEWVLSVHQRQLHASLQGILDALERHEEYPRILLLQRVVRRHEVAIVLDRLDELWGGLGQGVGQRPDALPLHDVHIVHHVQDQTLDEASRQTSLHRFGGLSCDISDRPGDLFAHDLLRVVKQTCKNIKDASLDDSL